MFLQPSSLSGEGIQTSNGKSVGSLNLTRHRKVASAATCTYTSLSPKAETELASTPSLNHAYKSRQLEHVVGYEVNLDLAYLGNSDIR